MSLAFLTSENVREHQTTKGLMDKLFCSSFLKSSFGKTLVKYAYLLSNQELEKKDEYHSQLLAVVSYLPYIHESGINQLKVNFNPSRSYVKKTTADRNRFDIRRSGRSR